MVGLQDLQPKGYGIHLQFAVKIYLKLETLFFKKYPYALFFYNLLYLSNQHSCF